MPLTLRPGKPDDAAACGRICFDAFTTISKQHNFPPDFTDPGFPVGFMAMMLGRPDVFSVIAERDGVIVGSNFMWENNGSIAGVGPITVDPKGQNAGVGKSLMIAVLDRARQQKFPGVRLVQAAFHSRSLSLYAKLGFNIVEPLACVQGKPPGATAIEGPRRVRAATANDIDACNALCWSVHGHNRAGDLRDALAQNTASVVELDDRITGYTTGVGFFTHTVGQANADVAALIAHAAEITGPGLLLPTRNTELLRWCLGHGLRVIQPMTLMALGLYQQPRGAFLPSILY
jgi:GNAT superfamily N-acetyltransferase